MCGMPKKDKKQTKIIFKKCQIGETLVCFPLHYHAGTLQSRVGLFSPKGFIQISFIFEVVNFIFINQLQFGN